MSLQTIITVTLCAVILVGCATILHRLYPETKGVERGVIVVVCCLLIAVFALPGGRLKKFMDHRLALSEKSGGAFLFCSLSGI